MMVSVTVLELDLPLSPTSIGCAGSLVAILDLTSGFSTFCFGNSSLSPKQFWLDPRYSKQSAEWRSGRKITFPPVKSLRRIWQEISSPDLWLSLQICDQEYDGERAE